MTPTRQRPGPTHGECSNPLHDLRPRPCPVCGSTDDRQEWYRERIDPGRLGGMSYASRKEPEFMNLRMVACPVCRLLYAPRVPSTDFLRRVYAATGYDSDAEARFAASSYAAAVRARIGRLPDRASALEVGCGNGALLPFLCELGFAKVVGVEPSREAANAAPAAVRGMIRVEPFDAAQFAGGSFSLVVANQTLEHVDDPCGLLASACSLLKPGGALMIVSHDYRHWLMRLLGSRSPIIDIEHLQVFSPGSLEYALLRAGFSRPQIEPFANRYPLHYWMRLLPIPAALKRPMLGWLQGGRGRRIGSVLLRARVGNMLAWATAPGRA